MTSATDLDRRPATRTPDRDRSTSPTLAGTGRLLRLALRRDRIVLTVWLVALVALVVATVASLVALYPTEAERTQYALVAASNVVARAFDGPMAGTSLGAIVMTEVFGILALLAGIMSVQAVVRHTRLEEETGRAELVAAAVVGRDARLVAALLVVVGANLVLGVLTAGTLVAAGLPTTGAVLADAAVASVGISFAAVGAVAVQVAGTARGANAIGISIVGAAFLLRAVGDAFGEVADSGVEVISAWPSWVSPIGWLPRRSMTVAWAAVLGSFIVGQFGDLLELPEAVMNLDPYRHLPAVPAEPMEALPVVVLLAVAVVLTVVGFVGWRRRDLEI